MQPLIRARRHVLAWMLYHTAHTLQSQYRSTLLITLSSVLIVLRKIQAVFFFFLAFSICESAGSYCKHKWLIQIWVQAELVLSNVPPSGLRQNQRGVNRT